MKSKMKAFIAVSAVIVCLVYLLSHTKTASAAKGPKVTDKVGNLPMLRLGHSGVKWFGLTVTAAPHSDSQTLFG
jgi:hypothetical protein